MRAKEEAFRILEAALSVASTGVDEAEVCLGGGALGVTRFSNNEIHPAGEHDLELLSMRMVLDGRQARARTSDTSSQGIKDLATSLRARVERMPDAVAEGGLPPPQHYEDIDAYDPETEAFTPLDREGLAGAAIRTALQNDLSCSGYVAVRRGGIDLDGAPGVYAVANTRGLLAYHPETRITFSVAMTSAEGTRGWAEDESFTIAALEPNEIVRSAKKRALLGTRPAPLSSGTYEAILEPAAVAELVAHVGRTAGAGLMQAGGSFLSGRIGESVAASGVTIRDDFTHALHRGMPFDAEGVARESVTIVDGGVARAPVVSWRSAQRLEVEPTGHGDVDGELVPSEVAGNLVLEGGTATFGDLVGGTKAGVLISRLSRTQLVDSRSLTITGATRDGLFLIEDGEPIAQLEDMCFTVSVLDLLGAAGDMTGSTWSHGAVVPAMKVAFPLGFDAP